MFDELNQILKDFTDGYEDTSEYAFIQSLVDIILAIDIPLNSTEYHSCMRLNRSISHSYEFLKGLKKEYAEQLHFILESGHITYDESKEGITRLSQTIFEGNERRIILRVRGNIEDSYTLTHEYFHYANMDINNITNNWDLMTEAISITSEGLQKEYFRKLGARDFRLNELDILYALKVKAIQLDFELQLIYTYLKYGQINEFLFSEIFNYKSDFYFDMAYADYLEIKRHGEMSYPILQRNVVGGVLANHMLYRIGEDSKKLGEFITVHENCTQMCFTDTLKFLDLDVVDDYLVLLSKDSLKTLKKEYVHRVKSVYK